MDKKIQGAEEVVKVQLDAYNANDFNTFADCYDKKIISYDLNTGNRIDELSGDQFFSHYRCKLSENRNIHCLITQRIVIDNLVVDKEIISNYRSTSCEELVIYQVDNGVITKMWFKK